MTRAPYIVKDPVRLCGTNYVASIAFGTDKVLGTLPFGGGTMFTPGFDRFFDPVHNDDELRALASRGINNIRLWGSFWAWVFDAPGYMQALATVAGNCLRHGISITYVVWNSTATDAAGAMLGPWNVLLPSTPSPGFSHWATVGRLIWDHTRRVVTARPDPLPGEPWGSIEYDEPGNVQFRAPHRAWNSTLMLFINAYLRAIAEFFTQREGTPVFASYDLFNEAEVIEDQDTHVRPNVIDFIAHTYQEIMRYHPRPPCTVGWAFLSDYTKTATDTLRTMGVAQTYVSSHTYEHDVAAFRAQILDARNFAASRRLPYVCSEFWERRVPAGFRYPRPMAPYVDIINEAMVGGQVWGFLAYNVFLPLVQGGPDVAVDGFLTPEPGQFEPVRSPDHNVAFGPLPWPSRVRIVPTPPGPYDTHAVRRWTESRNVRPAPP